MDALPGPPPCRPPPLMYADGIWCRYGHRLWLLSDGCSQDIYFSKAALEEQRQRQLRSPPPPIQTIYFTTAVAVARSGPGGAALPTGHVPTGDDGVFGSAAGLPTGSDSASAPAPSMHEVERQRYAFQSASSTAHRSGQRGLSSVAIQGPIQPIPQPAGISVGADRSTVGHPSGAGDGWVSASAHGEGRHLHVQPTPLTHTTSSGVDVPFLPTRPHGGYDAAIGQHFTPLSTGGSSSASSRDDGDASSYRDGRAGTLKQGAGGTCPEAEVGAGAGGGGAGLSQGSSSRAPLPRSSQPALGQCFPAWPVLQLLQKSLRPARGR